MELLLQVSKRGSRECAGGPCPRCPLRGLLPLTVGGFGLRHPHLMARHVHEHPTLLERSCEPEGKGVARPMVDPERRRAQRATALGRNASLGHRGWRGRCRAGAPAGVHPRPLDGNAKRELLVVRSLAAGAVPFQELVLVDGIKLVAGGAARVAAGAGHGGGEGM